MLHEVIEALGWQGGTIHQAIAEIRRLKRLDRQQRDARQMGEDFNALVVSLPRDFPAQGLVLAVRDHCLGIGYEVKSGPDSRTVWVRPA